MGTEVGSQLSESLIDELRKERASLWRILFEQSRDGIVVLKVDGSVFEANQEFARMLGYSIEEIRQMRVWEWDVHFSKTQILEKLAKIGDPGEQLETRKSRKDGSVIDVELSNSATVFEGKKLIFCICRDITQRKLLEAEIFRYATTDNLTGLFNRRSFDQRLTEEMDLTMRYGSPMALVMYDFDGFKDINDAHGHVQGDKVLEQSARLVRDNVRSTDMVVRWGGEEFMILVPQARLVTAKVLAEKLRQVLEEYVFSARFHVTASFGVTEYVPGESKDTLLKRVDDALYRAKALGRNRVEVLGS